jgi:hypothetical protein
MKELKLKEQNEVALDVIQDIMDDMYIDTADLVIPKVLLMQPTSAFVAEEGIAQVGDFRHSTTKEKLGSILEPITIIPFHYTKCIDVMNAEDGSLLRKIDFNLENSKLPREDKEKQPDGRTLDIKRFTRLDFFCLVPKLLDLGHSLPCVISFKSTGYRSGGIILTEWQQVITANQQAKAAGRKDLKLPIARVFELAGIKRTNDKKQTFCVPSIVPAGWTTPEHQRLALKWLSTVKTSNVVVDQTDEQVVDVETTTSNDTGNY